MDIAAGEYGYHLPYFQQMLDAGAVDCLQADVTRALGISGVLRVAALCDARSIEHDHVRIERIAFDGVLEPQPGGVLRPDRSSPGLGLEVKHADLEQYRVG